MFYILVAFYHAKLEFTDIYHVFAHAILLQNTVETYVFFDRTLRNIVNISIVRCHHVHKTSSIAVCCCSKYQKKLEIGVV